MAQAQAHSGRILLQKSREMMIKQRLKTQTGQKPLNPAPDPSPREPDNMEGYDTDWSEDDKERECRLRNQHADVNKRRKKAEEEVAQERKQLQLRQNTRMLGQDKDQLLNPDSTTMSEFDAPNAMIELESITQANTLNVWGRPGENETPYHTGMGKGPNGLQTSLDPHGSW